MNAEKRLGWVHIVRSRNEFEKLHSFISDINVTVEGYCAIDGSFNLKSGQKIGLENHISVALLTSSWSRDEVQKIIDSGIIDPDLTFSLRDIDEKYLDINQESSLIRFKRAKYFRWHGDFIKFLSQKKIFYS